MASDCPICLNEMSEGDLKYPLLCPTQCGYNFCLNCVEHLVDSSQDDYQEASDGNRHVKVRLHCPQCRGDLTHTIRDTLLLRKALAASHFTEVVDSELTATELVTKHDFMEKYANDVEHAEARLRKFQRDHGETELVDTICLSKTSSSEKPEDPFVDTTLFGGLEYAMSQAEQGFVTELMISGDVQKLVQAAHLLHGIFEISLTGLTPSMKANLGKPPTSNYDRAQQRKQLEAMEIFRKRHPLPARMPKFVVLKPFSLKKKTIDFKDDEWDGSIADAFVRVKQRHARPNPGVDKIIQLAEDPILCSTPTGRVKIQSIKGQAGRVGLQKGDVVSYVNAEPFTGTAESLADMINAMYETQPEDMFQLVVNADDAVAEALRLRGKAARETLREHKL